MTYAATIAEGWDTIRTDRPLYAIAMDQVTSRVLSDATRVYFSNLVNGTTSATAASREVAFFEAAASYSTRKGQSYARRVALGDLHRLHVAAMTGVTVRGPRYYTAGLPATVIVNPDGTVEVSVDLTEAASMVADTDQPGAVDDSAIVAAAVANHSTALQEA